MKRRELFFEISDSDPADLELHLCYSLDNEWMALESQTDGRSLRYVLL